MEWPLIGNIDFKPNKLAQGGVIGFTPSLNMMGDDSPPERVIPLDKLNKMIAGNDEPKLKPKLSEITIKLTLDATEFMESLTKVKAELLEIIALKEKVGLSVSPELPQTEEEMFDFLKDFTGKMGHQPTTRQNVTMRIDGKTLTRTLNEYQKIGGIK